MWYIFKYGLLCVNVILTYVVSILLLAASKIYLAVVIFQSLDDVEPLVANSLGSAFTDDDLKQKFNDVEIAFQCCGTVGPESYMSPVLPDSCCSEPFNIRSYNICVSENAFEGCNNVLSQVCSSYGEAVGIVIVLTIIMELAAIVFSLSIFCRGDKKQNT